MSSVFESLGIPKNPVMLAPLAGVSDSPFRRVCQAQGADLSYVEMLSATALLHDSRRTFEMMHRHKQEPILGVQITSRSADDLARSIEKLPEGLFETIDINMGCPVKKVVKTGCGSAILQDIKRIEESVAAAKRATDLPVSAKVRLGWDRQSVLSVEIAQAVESGGADWLVVHGRTRADDYSVPVRLDEIAKIKSAISIPVIGNGNLFSRRDALLMQEKTGVDGWMISRGALGDPWLFRAIKEDKHQVSLEEWLSTVTNHLVWQEETYGDRAAATICMRKHLLWYAKGWPGVKQLREAVNEAKSLASARALIEEFARGLLEAGVNERIDSSTNESTDRFSWDPKWEMDRQLDRGVGSEM